MSQGAKDGYRYFIIFTIAALAMSMRHKCEDFDKIKEYKVREPTR